MTDNASSYEVVSGLVDDFDCEILDAWFATDSRYNNGQTTLLFWKCATDDEDHPVLDEGDAIRFACGKDWESLDGGKTVENGDKKKFNNQSAVGTLITRVGELGGLPTLIERGPAQNAEVWIGLKFHMKREPYKFNRPDGKGGREEVTMERLLPNAFLGVGDGSGPDASESAGADAAPTAPSILESLDPEVVGALKSLKESTPNHSAFVDAAMELTTVTGNTTLVMALATPDGVYAEL